MHPSIYRIFDEYSNVFLNSRDFPFRNRNEEIRQTILPENGFWDDGKIVSIEDPAATRILVLGNAGIGKSTLINKVFGAEVVS